MAPAGDVPLGTTAAFAEAATVALPVIATIEPDADGDGFGDETQGLCPQSAQVQVISCPTIVLDVFSAPGKGSLSMVVTSSATWLGLLPESP